MINWFESEKKSLTYSIKLNGRAILTNISLLVFNIAMLVFEYKANYLFPAGCFASNALWTFCLLGYYIGEWKSDKNTLRHYQKIESESKLQDAIQEYEKAKKTYDDFFTRQNVVGGDTKKESESTGCGNSFVCKQADVQNCH